MKKDTAKSSAPAARRQGQNPEQRLLERKVRAATRTLLFEKLWPRVWLPLGIAGVFVLLCAFEVWQLLPARLHLGLLWGFGIAFALSLLPLLLWRAPSRERSLARLEKASALDHRPLTAFNDTLSQDTAEPATVALWRVHRARAAQSLSKLTSGAPHPRIDRYDPFALRAALVLMLFVVGVWAWTDLGARVRAAFLVPEIAPGANFRIDAWISPPPYTRREPFVLANGASGGKDGVSVPQGSTLTVKINGSDAGRYHVVLTTGQIEQLLEPIGQSGDRYAEYAQKVDASGSLSIRRGFSTERTWTLNVVPDTPPAIAFLGPIEVSPRAVMLFKYRVEDDYGVSSAEARIERIVPSPGKGGAEATVPQIGKPPVFALSLPRSPVKAADAKTYKDLTAHPWAGLPVIITLIARDEAGQEGRSVPRGIILPERKFTKPLAKAVIEQRRALVENPTDTSRVASNLNALAISAADDSVAPTIYLSLRSAYWRLRGFPSIEEVETTVEQLWDVALRIEDGNLSAAERDLRAAQDRLKDALENGASPEEIQKLMAELRQALNRYLQALAQQNANRDDRAALSPNTRTISPQDLQQLLNKIEGLAKAGSPEAAAQMLNELRDILESLQTGRPSNDNSDEDAQNLQQLDRLTDLMRQQQQLLDETFRAQQNEEGQGQQQRGQRPGRGPRPQQGDRGQQGQQGGQPSSAELKKRQDELRRQLQDLLSEMGRGQNGDAARESLREAEEAMGDAGDALGQRQLGEAGEQESRALESLRQGSRALAEEMMRQAGAGRPGNRADRDPLGRKPGGQLADPGDSVKVPDEITVQRAREILGELRKRLGQPSRPAIELDYLGRLIKPY